MSLEFPFSLAELQTTILCFNKPGFYTSVYRDEQLSTAKKAWDAGQKGETMKWDNMVNGKNTWFAVVYGFIWNKNMHIKFSKGEKSKIKECTGPIKSIDPPLLFIAFKNQSWYT